MTSHVRILVAAMALALSGTALAQTLDHTRTAPTQTAPAERAGAADEFTTLNAHDRLLAQLWDLSDAEMLRAKVLLEGPRKAFSVENISPLEALGIHARSDAERQKYAERFARAMHADVERSLAWNQAFAAAMQRLYPNEAVVNSAGLAPVQGPTAAADAAGVPRSLVVDNTHPLPAAAAAPASQARLHSLQK